MSVGQQTLAMLIGRKGMPLFSTRARMASFGLRVGRTFAEDDQGALGALEDIERALDRSGSRNLGWSRSDDLDQ